MTGTKPVLKMKECAQGDGDLCGGNFVDIEFRELLRKKFSDEYWAKMSGESLRKIMEDHWETGIKAHFESVAKARDTLIPVPFECQTQAERLEQGQQYIILTPLEIEQVFQPAFSRIFHIVDSQIAAMDNCPKVCLVLREEMRNANGLYAVYCTYSPP